MSARPVPHSPSLTLLYSADQVRRRVRALAETIRRDYEGHDLVVVAVLKGAFVFAADLVRALRLPVAVDFVGLSSYGAGTESSGAVTITTPLGLPVEGRDVLVVEDILDTGTSMKVLLDDLRRRSPKSVRLCALLDKRARRREPVGADYVGFQVAEGFVVGYGIDCAEQYRWLPGIHRIDPGEPVGMERPP